MGDFCLESADLNFMEEKSPDSFRLVILPVPFVVGRDIEVVEPRLVFIDPREGIIEIGLTGAEGFYFGPGELNPGFVGFLDMKIAAGFSVEDLGRAHRPQKTRRSGLG